MPNVLKTAKSADSWRPSAQRRKIQTLDQCFPNEAEARYGLTFYWEQVDYCVVNSSKKINGTFEITDLRTNEVLLVIEKGGWTGDCALPKSSVFDELATTLRSEWR